MKIGTFVDKVIKQIWIEDVSKDYDAYRLLKEDCLKNSYYHHLRRRLGDDFLDTNSLRIFTEFNEGALSGTDKRADIAIVKLKPEGRNGYEGHLKYYIDRIVAIIELKHKNRMSATDEIYRDFDKIKEYIQKFGISCQYYTGIIHEVYWEKKSWLDKRSTNHWADGTLTELVASRNEDGEMEFDVISYNGLNQNLFHV